MRYINIRLLTTTTTISRIAYWPRRRDNDGIVRGCQSENQQSVSQASTERRVGQAASHAHLNQNV